MKFLLKWRYGYGKIKKEIVFVDKEDAHFLRNRIYHVVYFPNGKPRHIRHTPHHDSTDETYLASDIFPTKDNEEIMYADGNPLNCRRSNLIKVPRWTSLSVGGNIAKKKKMVSA